MTPDNSDRLYYRSAAVVACHCAGCSTDASKDDHNDAEDDRQDKTDDAGDLTNLCESVLNTFLLALTAKNKAYDCGNKTTAV